MKKARRENKILGGIAMFCAVCLISLGFVLGTLFAACEAGAAIVLMEPFEDETFWRLDTAVTDCSIGTTQFVTGKAIECEDPGTDESMDVLIMNPDGVTANQQEQARLVCCFDHYGSSPIFHTGMMDLLNDAGTVIAKIRHENILVAGFQISNDSPPTAWSTGGESIAAGWDRYCFDFSDTDNHFKAWVNKDPSTEAADISTTPAFSDGVSALRLKSNGQTSYFDNMMCGNAAGDLDEVYNGVPRVLVADEDFDSFDDGLTALMVENNSCAACDDIATDNLFACVDGTSCTELGDEAHAIEVDKDTEYVYFRYADTPAAVASDTVIGVGLYGYLQAEGGVNSTQEWRLSGSCGAAPHTEGSEFVESGTIVEANNTWQDYFFFSAVSEVSTWTIAELDCLAAGIRKTNANNNLQVEAMYVVYATQAVSSTQQPIFLSRADGIGGVIECAQ